LARPIVLIPHLFRFADVINFRKDYSPPSSPPSRPFTKRVIISRHVYFDETCFPFAQDATTTTTGAHQCQPCIDDMIQIPTGTRTSRRRAPTPPRREQAGDPPLPGRAATPSRQHPAASNDSVRDKNGRECSIVFHDSV
jgi:hypothetical protein